MHVCTECKVAKDRSEFYASRGVKYAACKVCHRARITRRKDQAKQLVWQHLLEHPCVDCGETDPVVLEFDHVHGAKVTEVSKLVKNGNTERLVAEMAKCEVRCANCHRRATARRGGHFARRGVLAT